jgi:hypothetical protein
MPPERTTERGGDAYPPPRVYRAVLVLRRQGRRVENYCRDRRLHALDNAILDEAGLVAMAAAAESRAVPERVEGGRQQG